MTRSVDPPPPLADDIICEQSSLCLVKGQLITMLTQKELDIFTFSLDVFLIFITIVEMLTIFVLNMTMVVLNMS